MLFFHRHAHQWVTETLEKPTKNKTYHCWQSTGGCQHWEKGYRIGWIRNQTWRKILKCSSIFFRARIKHAKWMDSRYTSKYSSRCLWGIQKSTPPRTVMEAVTSAKENWRFLQFLHPSQEEEGRTHELKDCQAWMEIGKETLSKALEGKLYQKMRQLPVLGGL